MCINFHPRQTVTKRAVRMGTGIAIYGMGMSLGGIRFLHGSLLNRCGLIRIKEPVRVCLLTLITVQSMYSSAYMYMYMYVYVYKCMQGYDEHCMHELEEGKEGTQ